MPTRLRMGKVPWDVIADRVQTALPPEVLLGPGVGEDAALLRLGGETWAVASDPVSFTATDAGRLAVVVNANDVAALGARPSFFVAVVLLAPQEAVAERARELLDQIREACAELEVSLVGGHTEVTPEISHSLVVGTMLGRVEGRAFPTGGLREGDRIGITKWTGLEGTSILLADYGGRLRALHQEDPLRPLSEIAPGEWLSVVPEAGIAARVSGVTALHDVTEGGVGEALYEMGRASGLLLDVHPEEVPILPETRRICRDFGMDPLGLIGSGALLVGCVPTAADEVARAMAEGGVPFRWIGRAVAVLPEGARPVPRFERDEILKAGLLDGTEGVLFDMDGTLIDAPYDWPAIRRRLGVGAGSIIDHLNGLEDPERERRWVELRAIERDATRKARLKEGAGELVCFLRTRGIPTALVTNNDEKNARILIDRFGLDFDVVVTRDSGLWKPSGAPLRNAMAHLGVSAEHTLAVGDSRYDLLAAREAGCGCLCLLRDPDDLAREADLSFPDSPAFLRYLRLVL